MLRPIHVALVLSLCLVLTGCSSQQVPPSAGVESELNRLSKKIDLLVVRLPAPREPSSVDFASLLNPPFQENRPARCPITGPSGAFFSRFDTPKARQHERFGLAADHERSEGEGSFGQPPREAVWHVRSPIDRKCSACGYADLEGLNVILRMPPRSLIWR